MVRFVIESYKELNIQQWELKYDSRWIGDGGFVFEQSVLQNEDGSFFVGGRNNNIVRSEEIKNKRPSKLTWITIRFDIKCIPQLTILQIFLSMSQPQFDSRAVLHQLDHQAAGI